jgi:hypothetical protein
LAKYRINRSVLRTAVTVEAGHFPRALWETATFPEQFPGPWEVKEFLCFHSGPQCRA